MLLFTITTQAQTGFVGYNVDDSNFSNPERGLYYPITSRPTGATGEYITLASVSGQGDLNAAISQKISLIQRIIRLDDFRLIPISQQYLANITSDLNELKLKGLKCILRFSYSDDNTANNPTYYEPTKAIILNHIVQIKNQLALLPQNEAVISSLEAGFIGKYGEWFYSSNFTNLNSTNLPDRKEIGLKIMEISPNRMVAFRTPYFQQIVNGLCTDCARPIPYDNSVSSRTAAHNDCFLSTINDTGTYRLDPNGTTYENDKIFLEAKSKYTFTGGETCTVNEYNPPPYAYTYTNSTNALAQMSRFHFNNLNRVYNDTLINYWKTLPYANSANFFEEVQKKLGYRFVLINSNVINNVLTINLKNEGFANVFNPRKVYLVLKNNTTNAVFQVELTGTDIRFWNAGSTTSITKNLVGMTSTTGAAITPATYKMYLNLPDNSTFLSSLTDKKYSIRFANLNIWDDTTGWNYLFRTTMITTGSASRLLENDISIFEVNTSPNPFNESFKLNINTSSEEKINIKVFDMVGRLVDKVTTISSKLAEQELGNNYPAGAYNIIVTQGDNAKSLRIVKR